MVVPATFIPSFAKAQGTHLPATFRCGRDEVPLASVAVWCGASPFTVDCASGFEDFQHFVGQDRVLGNSAGVSSFHLKFGKGVCRKVELCSLLHDADAFILDVICSRNGILKICDFGLARHFGQ